MCAGVGALQGVVVFKYLEGRIRVFLAPGGRVNVHPEGYIVPPDGSRA